MKLSIKQKQEIYEHLLGLDCPDLLAALIAAKADTNILFCNSLSHCVRMFAWWDLTSEEGLFQELHTELLDIEDESQCKLLPQSTENIETTPLVSYPEGDYEAPTEADFAPTVITPAKIEINVDVSKFKMEMEKFHKEFSKDIQPSSLWTRVKLFLGKLFYRV